MHHANHWYGHANVMSRYTGLAGIPRIWGYLQHGWNSHDGFAVGTAFAPGFPKFVWSESVARRAWAAGLRNIAVVGSPWSYLLGLYGQDEWEANNPRREGTIVYPFHGWEQQNVVGSHADYVKEIRAVEGDVPITVCLYWNEYKDASVRRAYESDGFRVITHGYRGHMWRDTDQEFLDNQLREIRGHRRVVSNRMGSALFYGASTGAEVGIYGDPMVLEAERAILGGMQKQQRMFPLMHQPHVPIEMARQWAREELGMDELLSPAEIRNTFGWEHAQRASGGERNLVVEGAMGLAEDHGRGPLSRVPTDDKAARDAADEASDPS